jgi:hypothetical protein
MTVIFQATVRPSTKAIPLELDRDASGEDGCRARQGTTRAVWRGAVGPSETRCASRARDKRTEARPALLPATIMRSSARYILQAPAQRGPSQPRLTTTLPSTILSYQRITVCAPTPQLPA